MKRLSTIIILILACASMNAQVEFTDEYLDTVQVHKARAINDYMTVGVNYGVTLSRMYFNPSYSQEWLMNPNCISVMFTRYGKMFGYMPYFGIEAGFSYGHQGFRMKQNPESEYPTVLAIGTVDDVTYITEETMTVWKVPVRAKMHADMYPFRLMADVGIYGGWRQDVSRVAYRLGSDPSILNRFMDCEYRFDYGLEGGAGFAFLFDPVELHFNVLAGWSWNSLYTPDSSPSKNNKYYYRYANPIDIMVTVGLHFQLTKRTGRTRHELKRQAYEEVFGNPDSQDRE